MTMKKAFTGLMVMVICCMIMTGCSEPAQQSEGTSEAIAKAVEDGYKLSAIYGSAMSEEELAIWQSASDGDTSGLTPLTVLAVKSTDNGTTRLYLCRDMLDSTLEGWRIVGVESDTDGKFLNCKAHIFDIWIHTYGFYDTPEIPENKGWEIQVPADGTAMIVKDMYGVFQIAARHVEKEITYVPVVLLAEQLVAGTNYKYLCTDKPGDHLYILDIYEDMNSGAEITGVGYVDFDVYPVQ